MTNDEVVQFLADTLGEFGQLMIDTTSRLTKITLPDGSEITPRSFPVVEVDKDFNQCPKCHKDPLLFDYGVQWRAICPECKVIFVSPTKDNLMEAWNNLKLDEKVDWSDETTQSTGKTEGEITDV